MRATPALCGFADLWSSHITCTLPSTLQRVQAVLEVAGIEFTGSPTDRPGIRFGSLAKRFQKGQAALALVIREARRLRPPVGFSKSQLNDPQDIGAQGSLTLWLFVATCQA